jgi:hypothetical protein
VALAQGIHKKGTTKKTEKIWERIGRMKQKHRMVSGKYIIDAEAKEGIMIGKTLLGS